MRKNIHAFVKNSHTLQRVLAYANFITVNVITHSGYSKESINLLYANLCFMLWAILFH